MWVCLQLGFSRGSAIVFGVLLSRKSSSICQHLHLEHKTKERLQNSAALSIEQYLLRILYSTFTPAGNKSLVLHVICLSWLLLSLVLLCALSNFFNPHEEWKQSKCVAFCQLSELITPHLFKIYLSLFLFINL